MPELPEVETVRRGLAPAMEGATILDMVVRRANLRFPFPPRFQDRLIGQKILDVGRRAKYLLWHLDGDETVIVHLGMSGSFRVSAINERTKPLGAHQHYFAQTAYEKHDHVMLVTKQPGGQKFEITYNDPRRFGFMLMEDVRPHPMLQKLGVEPTGNRLDAALLSEIFAGKSTPLKAALLDQRYIAGLGNIYVCEALWRSGLSPFRAVGSLATKNGKPSRYAAPLADAIRAVISEAIDAGGSSLQDHRQTDGKMGYFQHRFAVYDKAGQACIKQGCGGIIERIVQSGRSTFYCPRCQR